MRRAITNFGGNIRFTPAHCYLPATEADVLALLDLHAHGKIRVVGAKHAWSAGIASDEALIDLRRLNAVSVERDADGTTWVRAGAGCRIHRLLRVLHARTDMTLPSIGLITEQTIAGAISTATHGSGKSSLSHYVDEIRVAAYDPVTGKGRIFTFAEGTERRAARCALGYMGVVVSVRIRCVPKYDVVERIDACTTLDEALAGEAEYPLQQLFFIPHRWTFFAQRRAARPASTRRSLGARLYRAYWFFHLDLGFHFAIKALASMLRSPPLIRALYRRLLPWLVLQGRPVIDTSERMLVMEHELFKHLEIEIFVPATELHRALDVVRAILSYCDDDSSAVTPEIWAALDLHGIGAELRPLRGTFTHHYPICIRRVLPDDTLISMTAGEETYYALSFITYVEPREPFYAMARILARALTALHRGRLHWGKHFPLSHDDIKNAYPCLAEFRALCTRVDPRGVFRNVSVDEALGFADV